MQGDTERYTRVHEVRTVLTQQFASTVEFPKKSTIFHIGIDMPASFQLVVYHRAFVNSG